MQEITEIPGDNFNQNHFHEHMAKEVETILRSNTKDSGVSIDAGVPKYTDS